MVSKKNEKALGGDSQMSIKFSITYVVTVDENNNILSSFEDNYEQDIHDLITDVMYDIDDVEISNLMVKERNR